MTHSARNPVRFNRVSSQTIRSLGICAVFALSACGGGQEGASSPLGQSLSTEAAPSAQSIVLQKEGARLNTAELEAIAKTGVLPKPFEGPLLSGAPGSTEATLNKAVEASAEANSESSAESMLERKSAASRVPVFRFYNSGTSAHFFTTSTTERDNVRANNAAFRYEGAAFYASNTAVVGLSPVHRFRNTRSGVHFYTISEAERALVVSNLPVFAYEGIAYYASTLPGTGYTPLYRFFLASRGLHFYTSSEVEKDNLIASAAGQYLYEGIGYYVLDRDWQTPALPHTGIGFSQCYQAGSNTMWACLRQLALALNPQQDGHRARLNRMSYSQRVSSYDFVYPLFVARYYPKTDCVRDDVTGLLWEGKESRGLRGGLNVYTNHGDNREGDAGAYVNMVNSMNLCGFNDWRLPQAEELQGLLLLGNAIDRIDSDFFPNTVGGEYWTSTADANDAAKAWRVQFGTGVVYSNTRSESTWLRLVRGSAWSGPRYMITTASYAGDAPSNAVLDRKTGLTWRRCIEGSFWRGANCSNAGILVDHERALQHANGLWRMPNVKELASLLRYERNFSKLDPSYFNPGGYDYWSSTPDIDTRSGARAFSVNFFTGESWVNDRSESKALRLVLIDP